VTDDDLSRQVDDLRASRARVVTSADAERRRIERELHDGVQQHLVALAVNIQLVRQLADSDLDAMRSLLDDVARDVREALESVRALAQTVYPPLLLDRGLEEALRAAVLEAGMTASVDVETTGRFTPEVEAAVYLGCVEAIVPGAVVHVWETDEVLRFEVAGKGIELDDASTASDRARALGGDLEFRQGRIAGWIPVER
jgi:signal transduction histidine kinase